MKNTYDFIMENHDVIYQRGHFTEKQKMQYAFAHLYEHKRERFYEAVDEFCERFQKGKKDTYGLYAFMNDLPVDYNTLYHCDFYKESKTYEDKYNKYVYYQMFSGAKYGKWLQDLIIRYDGLEIVGMEELIQNNVPMYALKEKNDERKDTGI